MDTLRHSMCIMIVRLESAMVRAVQRTIGSDGNMRLSMPTAITTIPQSITILQPYIPSHW